MMKTKCNPRNAHFYPILIGILLILAGLFIQIPGGVLTTYGTRDGDKTSAYEFDNKYSAIDEYVGGDAYNFIIGACLVAGKTAGTMAAKAICIVGGIMLLCTGLTLMLLTQNKETIVKTVPPVHSGSVIEEPESSNDVEREENQNE